MLILLLTCKNQTNSARGFLFCASRKNSDAERQGDAYEAGEQTPEYAPDYPFQKFGCARAMPHL